MNPVSFLDKLNKNSLYLILFLIPLFFLPFTQSVLGYPKQTLLLFLVFLSLAGWLGKQYFQGKIILRENKLLYSVLFFVFLFFCLSTFFSIWPTASLWGLPLSVTDNFITFFSFILLAFLFINTFQKEKDFFFAVFLVLISGALAGIFVILQLYGIFIFPFDFAGLSSFNTLGDVYQAAIFLALLLPVSLVLAFQIKKPIFWIAFFALLVPVILINFKDAWIVLLFGVLTVTIFGLVEPQGKIKGKTAFVLMILTVLSIFFIFFPLRFGFFPDLPLQVSPGTISEINILRGVYGEGIKNVLFGTGPGTFIFNYSQYRSSLLNLTFFWGTRFSSGSSEFLDWFITKGLLTGIFLLLFVFLAVFSGIKRMFKTDFSSGAPLESGMRLGFLASAVSLACAGFLYSFNFSLWFIFWIIMAGLLFYNSSKKEITLNSRFPRLVFSFIFLALIIAGIALFLFQGQKYLAKVNYARGVRYSQRENFEAAASFIEKATLFNPSSDVYWRDLAQLYLAQANLIAQDQNLAAEQKMNQVHQKIENGVQSLNRIIAISPFNVANWNVRGFFYRSLIGIPGAEEISLESYRRASELEPASPFPYGEMGRVHILMAQNLKGKNMEEKEEESLVLAVENLEKAIELKPDYAPAHHLLAVAYDQQGKLDEAIERFEDLSRIASLDIGISFQLAMLYWRKERLEESQRELEEIISLSPDYANARYMLGLVYDKMGKKEKAKEQFIKVVQFNPENQEIVKILENLEKGLPALEGIITVQPPIEEIPPEIQW